MPALPFVAQCLRSRILWHDANDNNISTSLYWRFSGAGPDAAEAITLGHDLHTLVVAQDGLYSLDVEVLGVEITDLSTNMGGQGTYLSTHQGTRTGTPQVGAAAVLANYTINRRYRGGKPRSYWPWGTVTDLSSPQTWSSGSITAFQTGLTAIITGFVGATAGSTAVTDHVNISYYEGFTTFTTPSGRMKNLSKLRATPVVDVIQSSSISATPGSQRRRNRS